MAFNPSWLVATEEDRRRIREVETSVTSARRISFWAIAAITPFLVQQHGWRVLSGLIGFGAYAAFVDRRYSRSDRPELWMFSLTLATQVTFCSMAALTGGPTSPALVWSVITMVSMPARYGTRGMIVGGAFSALCVVAGALSSGVDALAASPDMFLATLTAGVGVLAYGNALRQSEGQQRRAAILDPLTGLLNRTKLDERFEEVREVAMARDRSVAMLLLDLDHFKQVNDLHGHAAGDAVLVDTAYALRGALRDFELVYRLGGEEFAVFLPGPDLETARAIAERLRKAVETANPGGIAVTVSVGVAVASGEQIDLKSQLAAADDALYAAKRIGRNRVVAVDLASAAAPAFDLPPAGDVKAASSTALAA